MVNAFEATGTATFPSHMFFFGETDDPNDALCSFEVTAGTSVYYCDPYGEEIVGAARGFTKETRNMKDLDTYSKLSKFVFEFLLKAILMIYYQV
jgi:hypothetical protein